MADVPTLRGVVATLIGAATETIRGQALTTVAGIARRSWRARGPMLEVHTSHARGPDPCDPDSALPLRSSRSRPIRRRIAAGLLIGESAAATAIHFVLGSAFVLLAAAMFDFGLARWVDLARRDGGGRLRRDLPAPGCRRPDEHRRARLARLRRPRSAARADPAGCRLHLVRGAAPDRLDRRRAGSSAGSSCRSSSAWSSRSSLGAQIGIDVPFMKVTIFAPFVWLLIESVKRPASATDAARRSVGGRAGALSA